ncbi:hypothetical protein PHYPO_G00029860 [Pangasianodon hypophthalmus]|uniref:Ig-like domain-containing protein n=1 Tax=Pangasianodon hypophthalmus TaxID=310915 RepID=A0A5N5MJ98_PANHP|nr:hypothetical protein PHYPO_G00029860 [Pangasianodon hypophthalmus]
MTVTKETGLKDLRRGNRRQHRIFCHSRGSMFVDVLKKCRRTCEEETEEGFLSSVETSSGGKALERRLCLLCLHLSVSNIWIWKCPLCISKFPEQCIVAFLRGYHKVIESRFHLHGPSDPLIAQLGGSVMLPCFVERPLPIEELEVEWKRNDSETLVHLWQEGESRPESQNQRYRERAHFFTEEIAHGNFSLFLTNVTREDVGVYKCAVYTNLDSDETLIEIKEIERLIVSGGHVISAYAGEDVTLNCSVDSNIPPENIEEVSWKKMDEDILVLLYQESEVLTDSSHERYRDRVEFFSAEERNKGNFSLRLKSVQTEDKGLYICLAFSGALSDNTTVEVQQLGFSSMHIGIFVLCILGFVIGSLILGYLSFTSFKNEDDSRRALAIHCAHVLSPNITMFIVFILWGVTEEPKVNCLQSSMSKKCYKAVAMSVRALNASSLLMACQEDMTASPSPALWDEMCLVTDLCLRLHRCAVLQ